MESRVSDDLYFLLNPFLYFPDFLKVKYVLPSQSEKYTLNF